MSSFSVDTGVLDVWLLRDTELSDGDNKPECRTGALLCVGGARFLPLPRTRPPPRLRRLAIAHGNTRSSLMASSWSFWEALEVRCGNSWCLAAMDLIVGRTTGRDQARSARLPKLVHVASCGGFEIGSSIVTCTCIVPQAIMLEPD